MVAAACMMEFKPWMIIWNMVLPLKISWGRRKGYNTKKLRLFLHYQA